MALAAIVAVLGLWGCASPGGRDKPALIDRSAEKSMPIEVATHILDEEMGQGGWSSAPVSSEPGVRVTGGVCFPRPIGLERKEAPVRFADITAINFEDTPGLTQFTVVFGNCNFMVHRYPPTALVADKPALQAWQTKVATAFRVLAAADRAGQYAYGNARPQPGITVPMDWNDPAQVQKYIIEHGEDPQLDQYIQRYLRLLGSGADVGGGGAPALRTAAYRAPPPGAHWRIHTAHISNYKGRTLHQQANFSEDYRADRQGRVQMTRIQDASHEQELMDGYVATSPMPAGIAFVAPFVVGKPVQAGALGEGLTMAAFTESRKTCVTTGTEPYHVHDRVLDVVSIHCVSVPTGNKGAVFHFTFAFNDYKFSPQLGLVVQGVATDAFMTDGDAITNTVLTDLVELENW